MFGKPFTLTRTIVCFSIATTFIFSGPVKSQNFRGKVSVNALHQIYKKGDLFKSESRIFFDGQSSKLISHYLYPEEFYRITNEKGEITIYNPEDNTVSFTQNNTYSSSNELIYYFVNNQTHDMGLKKEGFIQTNTTRDGKHVVTTWQAPPGMKGISSVELVSKNFRPVFAQYFDNQGKVLKKIYYYNYFSNIQFSLPKKITEITYTAANDSTVRRTTYSEVRTGSDVDSDLFDFKIPSDAEKVDF
ncbi:MAG: LolA family protein [Bacteroidota bacterium]